MCRLTFVGTIIIVILSEAKNLPEGWFAAENIYTTEIVTVTEA